MTDETQAAAAQDTTAATQAEAAQSEGSVLTPDTTTQQPGAEGAAPAAQEEKPAEGEGEGKDTESDGKPADAGAPEDYADFTLPDGIEIDADVMTEFKGLAKELGISQEAAQKLIDLQSSMESKRAESLQQMVADQSQQWADQVKSDPEIGGEHYDKSVQLAVKTIETFGSPELRTLLNDSGLGNHPELVKFCHRIGKAISEDTLVMGGNQAPAKLTPEEIMYGKGA